MKRLIIAIALLVLLIVSPALAADVTLSWTAPDDERVTGYYVYYGQSNPPANEIDAEAATEQVISDLTEGQTYYFGAKSYDADGNTSVMSNIIEYTVVSSPQVITIPDRPSEIRILFQ